MIIWSWLMVTWHVGIGKHTKTIISFFYLNVFIIIIYVFMI